MHIVSQHTCTGLDSLAALKICETLHDFCSAGMIVLCTM
jgi:ABC-type multidrug transport system ATPase subunit